MSGDNYPTCEKSGLLISRCRCPQHRIPKRRYRDYLSRHQRERASRYRFARQAAADAKPFSRKWINDQWAAHAAEHPDMWSDEAKEFFSGRDN